MAQPPAVPPFDKNRIPGEDTEPVRWLWDICQDFFKRTSAALQRGVTVSENVAGGWVDIEVPAGASFPLPELANPLPAGRRPHGVLVAGVFNPAAPGRPLGLAGAVTVEWTEGAGGGVSVLSISGLPAGKAVIVRVLVLAE